MIIVWSEQAVGDLRALRDYIAQFNPAAASATAERIVTAVEGLREFPGMGRPGRKPHTRELVVPGTPSFVPYMVTDDRIEVIAVMHGVRKWQQE